MASGHGDVINSQITLMASSKFKYVLGGTWTDDVDDPAVVFLLTQTFKHQVVANWFLVLDQVIGVTLSFDHKRVSIFTNLALKRFPEEC